MPANIVMHDEVGAAVSPAEPRIANSRYDALATHSDGQRGSAAAAVGSR